MASLLSLVKQHGLGIKVKSTNPAYQKVEFKILKEKDKDFYEVVFSDGVILPYKKDEPQTNDYELVEK